MTLKRVLVGLAIIALGVTLAVAQSTKSTVIGTVHDTSAGGNGCLNCHVPHKGTNATILLWDHTIPIVSFGTYTSPTAQLTTSEIGGSLPTAADDRSHSLLCMSCHDAATATTNGITVGAAAQITSGAADPRSPGLVDDHPINMTYDDTLDTENGLHTLATVLTSNVVLFGINNTVQCASCHNPHDNTNAKYLRVSNTNSGLCTTCHL